LFTGGKPPGDLSSMEIVTRCCLGQTKTAEEHAQPSSSQPSLDVNTGDRPSKSQLSDKVSTDREAVSLASISSTAEVQSADEDDEPLASLLSVSQQRRRARKNSVKAEKDTIDSKKNAAKGRAAKKKSEKVCSRTSPRKSDELVCPTVSSAEPNATGKERSRRKTDKPAEAAKEKERGRKSRTAKKETNSPSKTPSCSGDLTSSPVRRKRRRSSAAETEQPAKNVVRLPDINCFLTGPVQNGGEHANSETATVTESCADKGITEPTDSCLQQNSPVSTNANSSVVPVTSEETTGRSSPTGSIIPQVPMTSSSSDCLASSVVSIPEPSHSVENHVGVSPATPLLGQSTCFYFITLLQTNIIRVQ